MIGLAPLTNIALAAKLDPELSDNLKNVVLMGGAIAGNPGEIENVYRICVDQYVHT